jgi:hypothetical protein
LLSFTNEPVMPSVIMVNVLLLSFVAPFKVNIVTRGRVQLELVYHLKRSEFSN